MTYLFERKSLPSYEIKGFDPKTRQFDAVATKEIVDRDQEIVRVKAFADGGLDNFMKNPVMLLNHDAFAGPIGKVLDISVKGDEMPFRGELRPPEDSDRMRDIVSAVEGGYLKSFSIGFRALKVEPGGTDAAGTKAVRSITKAELFEVSLAVLPANTEAVMKMAGLLKTITGSGLEMEDKVKTIWSVPSDLDVLRRARAIVDRLDSDERKGLTLPEDLAAEARELALYLWTRGEERAQVKNAEAALRDLMAAL